MNSKWLRASLAFLLLFTLLQLLNSASSPRGARLSFASSPRRRAGASAIAAAAPSGAAPPAAPGAPPPPWSPPALDPALARCIRDSAPAYRAYIAAEFKKPGGGGFAGGQLCNQCVGHIFPAWGQLVARNPSLAPAVVLDIGGNKGDLAEIFLGAFPPPTRVVSYELSPPTCAQLLARRDSLGPGADRARWAVVCEGVAAERGSMEFFSGGAGSPLSSLGRLDTQHETLRPGGRVNVTTVADIMALHGLEVAGLVKIDVEGWEREVLAGMRLPTEAWRYPAILFEVGEAWIDTRKGPSNATLAEVVDALSERSGPVGYACFYVGLTDLLPISPPWESPRAEDIYLGPNVLCLRRDAEVHRELLLAHRREVDHCLAGQGLWG